MFIKVGEIMNEDRLFKCDENKKLIPGKYAVIDRIDITEHFTFFTGKDIPKLNLKRGDHVFLNLGEIENKIKVYKIELFVDDTMIQCTIPPYPSKY